MCATSIITTPLTLTCYQFRAHCHWYVREYNSSVAPEMLFGSDEIRIFWLFFRLVD